MIIVLSLDVAKRFNNPIKDLENLVKFYEYNLTYSMDTKLEKIFYKLLNKNLEIKEEIINVINNNFDSNFNFKKINEVKDFISLMYEYEYDNYLCSPTEEENRFLNKKNKVKI